MPKHIAPGKAKCLIVRYLSEYAVIFNPLNGYSGIMLAASVTGKEYIGYEPNIDKLNESKQIIDYFELKNVELLYDVKDMQVEYPCIFTEVPNDTWIDSIMNEYKCNTYLFITSDPGKYKDNIIEEWEGGYAIKIW